MNSTFSSIIVALLFAISSLRADPTAKKDTAPPQARSVVFYTVIDLGTAEPRSITNSNQIVGADSVTRLGLYFHGLTSAPITLGALPAIRNNVPNSINPRGEIVGTAYNISGVSQRPEYWANSASAPFELLGRPSGQSATPFDINASGQIVGRFFGPGFSPLQAVFWPNASSPAVILSNSSTQYPFSEAFSINNRGQILGDICDRNYFYCQAALWPSSSAAPIVLRVPGGEFLYTEVQPNQSSNGINNAGNMVGYTFNADGSKFRAVYWASSSSPAVILPTSVNFPDAVALGINDNGQIIGLAFDADFNQHSFYWPSATSQGIDLSQFFGSEW